jgi:predicted transposase YdaD
MHEYDTTLKLLLQGRAEQSLRQLTGVAIARWLNVELPEIGNRRVDLLGETADGGLIHIELQSQNDGAMPLRMAEYCLRIYRRLQKLPRQIVLYVGREPLGMAVELVGPQQSFRYDLIDIRELDGETLAASDRVGDNVIAILTRLGNHARTVQEIVRKVSELEDDQREFYLQALLELAGLRGLEELVAEEARKVPITESILDNKVLGKEFQRGRDEGVHEGVQQGVQLGVQQGVQLGELGLLRSMIEARFGSVPKWAEERLASRPAPEIKGLGVRLLTAESLEELLK